MNTFSDYDRNIIRCHFRQKLAERYGIQGQSTRSLQKAFKKRLQRHNHKKYGTKLVKVYKSQDRNTRAWETNFMGKRVLFVYDSSQRIAKTALTNRRIR